MQSVGKESGKEVLLLVLLVALPLDFVLTDTPCALAVCRLVGCHYCSNTWHDGKLQGLHFSELKIHRLFQDITPIFKDSIHLYTSSTMWTISHHFGSFCHFLSISRVFKDPI